MPTANPFEDILSMVQITLDAVRDLAARLDKDRPEWESLKDAAHKRRKGERALKAAIEAGLIRTMRVPTRGGHDKWLLSTIDLDRHFPIQKK